MSKRKRRTPREEQPTDAGFWLRVGAKLIDHGLFVFVEAAAIGVGAYLNALGRPPWVIALGPLVSTLLWYVYVFEMTRRRGQTIGKIVARVRVVTPEGDPPGARVMLKRVGVEFFFDYVVVVALMLVGWGLAKSLDLDVSAVAAALHLQPMVLAAAALIGLSLVGMVNPLYMLISPRKQALHDAAAGTYVIRLGEERARGFALASILATGLFLGVPFGVVRPLFVEAYVVPTGSMEPTIQIGDRILANKLVHRLRPPRRREIIMFKAPEWVSEKRNTFVKRVVGIPGDRLQVKDGALHRDGKPVAEPYVMAPPTYTWPEDARDGGEVVVAGGAVVVMGDNRNNSNDSHAWTRITADRRAVEAAPFLPIETICGKLVYRYWPPDRMGTVAQEE